MESVLMLILGCIAMYGLPAGFLEMLLKPGLCLLGII